MSSNIYKVITGGLLLLGVGVWLGLSMKFKSEGKLAYDPNPACLKGSPYGKVLALALQGPIDFYWHKGQTHEHAEILNDDHGHDHGDGHHHHGDHSHGDDHPETTKLSKEATSVPEQAFHVRAKRRMKEMEAMAHRNTNGQNLTPQHVKYLQSVTEDKLRLAYELDPTNYTNYGNLHLFLITNDFGKNTVDHSSALILARETLGVCKQEELDPASWVTAASAAYNIIYHIGFYHEEYSIEDAKASLKEFDDCIIKFNELLDLAVANNRIISKIKYDELKERVRYMGKLRYAQGAYMERIMSSEMKSSS